MKILGLALCLLLSCSVPASAGERQARLAVTATVQPRATLELLAAPPALELNEEQVRRGYVELSTRYRVRNNDPDGFVLHLHRVPGYAGTVRVSGLGQDLALEEDCTEIPQRAAATARDFELKVRVGLPGDASPGRMPLPFSVSVTPL